MKQGWSWAPDSETSTTIKRSFLSDFVNSVVFDFCVCVYVGKRKLVMRKMRDILVIVGQPECEASPNTSTCTASLFVFCLIR